MPKSKSIQSDMIEVLFGNFAVSLSVNKTALNDGLKNYYGGSGGTSRVDNFPISKEIVQEKLLLEYKLVKAPILKTDFKKDSLGHLFNLEFSEKFADSVSAFKERCPKFIQNIVFVGFPIEFSVNANDLNSTEFSKSLLSALNVQEFRNKVLQTINEEKFNKWSEGCRDDLFLSDFNNPNPMNLNYTISKMEFLFL